MSDEHKVAYEKRLILFMDFLGFREVVADTKDNEQSLVRLISAMNVLRDVVKDDELLSNSQCITQFSDSIVMSYRVSEPSGVYDMLYSMALSFMSIIDCGFLLRGAITMGDLYHTERHLVGPAMVKAYDMESNCAKYPRIIIDPSVVSIARENPAHHHEPDQEERYVRDFLKKDQDGWLYFDYTSRVAEHLVAEEGWYFSYLLQIGSIIERGLGHKDPKVIEKYLWLHRNYIAAIDSFLIEFRSDFPRHDNLADQARRKIAAAAERAGFEPARRVTPTI